MTESTGTTTSEEFRAIADKGVAQARVNYDNAKAASEEASVFLKDSFAKAAKGTTDYNLKIIEIARTNFNAAFDYVHEIFAVKSPSEFVELSTAHAQKHFATTTQQCKELAALTQKVATNVAEPLKTGIANALNSKFA
jgi:phasin